MYRLILLLMFPCVHNLRIGPVYPGATKVNIHLEKFNVRYNLLHIGISFESKERLVRFDYRPFNDNSNYDTTNIDRSNFATIFPNIYIPNDVNIPKEMEKKNIHWGNTNKTIYEIFEFEKTLHRKYILGVYDCRHYVHRFTKWALDNPTPIWHLHKLWDEL